MSSEMTSSQLWRAGWLVALVLACIPGQRWASAQRRTGVLQLDARHLVVVHVCTRCTRGYTCVKNGQETSDLLLLPAGCLAYPELFAAKYATTSCIDHPSQFQRYGSHGRMIVDT